MRVAAAGVMECAGDAVGPDAGAIQEATVGGAGGNLRDDRDAGPQLMLTASTAPMSSGVSGGSGDSVALTVVVILIWSSAITRASVACTSATFSPGRMRQFTVALARCGSAFSAWPASTIVVVQVVRTAALK